MRSVRNWNPDPILPKAFSLYEWLESNTDHFNRPSFIAEDPISVPHRFSKKQDIEIAGLFAAIMAWGQRPTIIRKANELMQLMEDHPHEFIVHHKEKDRKRFNTFKHRTLQPDDVLYLVDFLQKYYQEHESLEMTFADAITSSDEDVYNGLTSFHNQMFSGPWILERTRKHISTPERKSSCKRLNMYLRWMVRKDERGVDFGLWKKIKTSQLVIPLDLHVGKIARELHLLHRPVNDWQAAKELTNQLKQFDPVDPVKYDFALFGASAIGGL